MSKALLTHLKQQVERFFREIEKIAPLVAVFGIKLNGFLDHLLRDDLINPVKVSVRPSVRPSVRIRTFVRTYVGPYVRPQSNTMQPQTK